MTLQSSPPTEEQQQAVQSPREIHLSYLRQTIDLAQKSPPKPTNFRVGCVIVSDPLGSSSPLQRPSQEQRPKVLSTGYTLELVGNTHAEQCALYKLALSSSVLEEDLGEVLTPDLNTTLYTSLEPCGKRLSGNLPCVQRIISTTITAGKQNPSHQQEENITASNLPKRGRGGIRKVIFGAKEPGTFVQDSQSCRLLTEAGIEWEYISDYQDEILRVAMEGHHPKVDTDRQENIEGAEKEKGLSERTEPKVDRIADEEQKRQEAMPRNPKKRMMEAPPQPQP